MASTTEMLAQRFPDLEYHPIPSAETHPRYNYTGFHPSSQTLQKGFVKSPGRRAFNVDVRFDRDVAVTMRDGVKIYMDIFRPLDSDANRVPVLIPWSPYGKTGTGPQQYETMGPFNCGVPTGRVSGFQKFEAPDPAEWCERGYAIANVDARGAGKSDGFINYWGQQEAEDIYDTIDWLANQPWCSGSVGMAGNSWLAIAQINFASRLKHPALKALAPMEALNDPYRDRIGRGGKPHLTTFMKMLLNGFAGPNGVEDMPAMLEKRPLYDEYWESKYIHTENIDVPLYLTASYSSALHTAGSFNTYRTAKTSHKWLRVHPYQEWYDLYRPEITDELQRFFDRYCKGIENGWEHDTPPVRLSLLALDGSSTQTIVERPELEYPLSRQKLQAYYLDASSHTLSTRLASSSAKTSYDSHSLAAKSDFIMRFDKYTEVAGYSKVHLWMSCAEKDDMDVGVMIRKIDSAGKLLEHLNYPCPVPTEQVPNVNVAKTLGPQGFLRASHRISRDDSRSRGDGQELFYTHDRREPIKPGTIVELQITLWPIGMVFAPGEGIVLSVSGHDMIYPEVDFLRLQEPDDENVGTHNIHTGGQHESRLILPIIS
ncbi:hypothetical protein H2204_004765 [Knufia peltigerae]|uniref:Xaa-Pro dipeptidyl-peptidase C-terminal domain-containing protein n=1 Tax=Knufia peltigerae TaxID=1002370 RepID=A0AA38Y6Z0_9EURO|nr:hypothetical protein H2204_004765 [Knufia peltigerae]